MLVGERVHESTRLGVTKAIAKGQVYLLSLQFVIKNVLPSYLHTAYSRSKEGYKRLINMQERSSRRRIRKAKKIDIFLASTNDQGRALDNVVGSEISDGRP